MGFGLLAANGVDNLQASARTLWNGNPVAPLGLQLAEEGAQAAGLDPRVGAYTYVAANVIGGTAKSLSVTRQSASSENLLQSSVSLETVAGQTEATTASVEAGVSGVTGSTYRLSQATADEILAIPKGSRPDPTTYLPQEFIDAHLSQFEGGVTKFSSGTPTGTVGPPGGTFVMPQAVADHLVDLSEGDPGKLEDLLGLDRGTLGSDPVRIDIPSPAGLRVPSGNELGANSQWAPGGYTSGGIPEATINPASPGTYVTKPVFPH